MSDRPEPLTPDQERARAALLGLEAPPARPEFRKALARDFASGAFAEPRTAPAHDVGRARGPSWWSWPVLRWALAPVAMTALAIALVIGDRGARWEVMSASGTGIAVVDDRPIPMAHLDDLRRALHAGARLRVPEDSEIEIASRGNLAFHVAPGTDLTLPPAPGRWFDRSVESEIRSGEMRVTSGSGFHGARLTIRTPEAMVRVTGTTFAVIREPAGTCVCVLEGTVVVGTGGGAMVEVPKGERRFVFNDGRAPESAAIRDTEIAPLGAFRERCAAMMGR